MRRGGHLQASFSASSVIWKTVIGTLMTVTYSIKLELFSSATEGQEILQGK